MKKGTARILALLLAMALLGLGSVALADIIYPSYTVPSNYPYATNYTATKETTIRSGPGSDYSKLGTLSKGQVVSVVGESGSWKQIVVSTGVPAYVKASNLALYTTPTYPTYYWSGSYPPGSIFYVERPYCWNPPKPVYPCNPCSSRCYCP